MVQVIEPKSGEWVASVHTATRTNRRRILVWRLPSRTPESATVRYRCLLPLQSLRRRGWESLVTLKGETIKDWSEVVALIVVKTFRTEEITLARSAQAAGVPVIFDLCDNLFAKELDSPAMDEQRAKFLEIARLTSAVVVVSPVMHDLIGPHLDNSAQLRVVPDQVETEDGTRAAFDERDWRADPRRLRSGKSLRAVKRRLREFGRRLSGGALSLEAPGPTPPRRDGLKRLLWFGHHGRIGYGGLASLAEICPALAQVHKRQPFELLVVSDSKAKFQELIAPYPFPQHYRPWHPIGVFDDIRSADAVLLPNSLDHFSLPKSAGRATLTFSQGVPVIATMVPALEPLAEVLITGDWEARLGALLSGDLNVDSCLSRAETIIEEHFSESAVAALWEQVLLEVSAASD